MIIMKNIIIIIIIYDNLFLQVINVAVGNSHGHIKRLKVAALIESLRIMWYRLNTKGHVQLNNIAENPQLSTQLQCFPMDV